MAYNIFQWDQENSAKIALKWRQNVAKISPNSKFKNPINKIAGKMSSKNIEKCRSSNISDWDWAKSANGNTADFVTFLDFLAI